MAPTNYATAPKSPSARNQPAAARILRQVTPPAMNNVRVAGNHESVASFYPEAGGHNASDGGDHAVRPDRLSLPAGRSASRGRLSDHPGADVLSRREPGYHDILRHRAAGSTTRPDAEPHADEFGEFGRSLGHHAAIRA